MWPVLGGLISGGIGAISSMFNTSQNNANQQQMQQQAEQFDQQTVQEQQNYETQMSNTAYQRASADMSKAGLNPAAMFGSGSAASTPSISAPTIQPAQKSSAAGQVGSQIQQGISTAVALKTADATIDNLVDQNAKIKAETLTEQQRPGQVLADTGVKDAEYANVKSRTDLTQAERANVEARLPFLKDEGVSAKNRMNLDPTVRKVADDAAFLGGAGSKALAPISTFVGSARGVASDLANNSFRSRYYFGE